MRVAIVHDSFVQPGGGERVAAELTRLFGGAPMYAGAVRSAAVPEALRAAEITSTFVNSLVRRGAPLASVAPMLPFAFSSLELGDADVVVSSSSAFAHHVRIPAGAVHVCYCHTPPRFLWEPGDYFLGRPVQRALSRPALGLFRRLDRSAARTVDLYVANSLHVASKIRRVYGRDALVVYPPVDTDSFRPTSERSGRFLVVSRLRNQKRIDLAVAAANLHGLPLDIIGEGPELGILRAMAGPTVRFLGRLPDAAVRHAMARSAAVIVPAVQDFGLTIVEAQASGRPPIAFAQGGALESVEDGRTGFLFAEQTPAALGIAMVRALAARLDPEALFRSAARFDVAAFRSGMRAAVGMAVAEARLPDPEMVRGRTVSPRRSAPLSREGHEPHGVA